VIVLDSSALVDWLLNARVRGANVGRLIEGAGVAHTLDMAHVEVLSALRRKVARRELDSRRAREALADLADTRLMRHPATPLGGRIWSLRETHSACDAAYIALAEALDLPLVTTDGRLARSHGHAAEIIHAGAG
jgi:predicted nucleic acid-binding protein